MMDFCNAVFFHTAYYTIWINNLIEGAVMAKKLAGKVAIVTGASKGIGASIALHLAAEGAAVAVNYSSSKEGAERVVKEIERSGGNAIIVQANMTNPKDIQRLFSETKKAFGKLDILVNNAGIYYFTPIEELSSEDYHKMFDLNVLGLLLASKEAVKSFGTKGGSIVNISSVVSASSEPGLSIYCGTKGAVDAITRSLAAELGPRKIRVNTINPGLVETEGTHAGGMTEDQFRKDAEKETPLGRIGQPQDIAHAAVFLASDDASWITGESLFITGGYN
jgi:3-oxoacyl-[acyl-carrier protein] reductase